MCISFISQEARKYWCGGLTQPAANYTHSCLLTVELPSVSISYLGKPNTLPTGRWMILSFFQLVEEIKGVSVHPGMFAHMGHVYISISKHPQIMEVVWMHSCFWLYCSCTCAHLQAHFWQSGHSHAPHMWIVHDGATHCNSSTHACIEVFKITWGIAHPSWGWQKLHLLQCLVFFIFKEYAS